MASTAASTSKGESSKPKAGVVAGDDDAHRRKILVVGSRKAGKSSCIKTVFQQVPVKDTSYFGVTQKVEKIKYDSIIPLQIWDTPSNFEMDQLEIPLSSFSSLIYVMDMQQEEVYRETIVHMVGMMLRALVQNPALKFSVLIHKSELSSEDYRGENYAEIQKTFHDELEDFSYHTLQPLDPNTNYSDRLVHQSIQNQILGDTRLEVTSIHNVSLRDAWSKVLQASMEMLPAIEALILNFTETSGMDNSFLFDIKSGIVLASDNRHRNDATLELVTEYLARFLQFSDLYKELHHDPPQENGGIPHGDENGGEDEEEEYEGEDEEEGEEGWWDREDPSAPWMFQATRLISHTTIAFWQFTPVRAEIKGYWARRTTTDGYVAIAKRDDRVQLDIPAAGRAEDLDGGLGGSDMVKMLPGSRE